MIPALIVVCALAAVAALLLVRRARARGAESDQRPRSGAVTATTLEAAYPPAGLLVQQDILRTVDASSITVWDALEASANPMAIEYHPVSAAQISKLRTVPVNASAQNAMVQVVKALNPKSPTLYTVVLP